MPSVLVVDDEDQVRQLIRTTFEESGYQVLEASSGTAALEQYRLTPTDLVVIDIIMPDQDGLESISTIRHESPKVKIIAMTGSNDMIGILGILDVAKMLGAHRVLHKPFEMKDLLEAAKSILQA
ncbi:MAG TPA: response regulator [Nitrospira sp.]|nr:response regulator [Nitrospira sp.]